LQRYETEFDFRWNRRKLCDAERLDSLLTQIGGRRVTYRHTSPASWLPRER